MHNATESGRGGKGGVRRRGTGGGKKGRRSATGWIAFSYKFMRAALQTAAGKSGKPGLYSQEFASFQRSFEERLEGQGRGAGEEGHVARVVKR